MFSRFTTTLRVLTVAGCLLGAASLHAQDSTTPPPGPPPGGPGAPGGMHGGRGGMRGGPRFDMLKGITLSADQKTKIDGIHEKYRKQMDSVRTNKGDRSAFRGLMESQMKEERDVLTADQQKVYDENLKEMRDRMKQRMQNAPPPPPPPQQ